MFLSRNWITRSCVEKKKKKKVKSTIYVDISECCRLVAEGKCVQAKSESVAAWWRDASNGVMGRGETFFAKVPVNDIKISYDIKCESTLSGEKNDDYKYTFVIFVLLFCISSPPQPLPTFLNHFHSSRVLNMTRLLYSYFSNLNNMNKKLKLKWQ